VSEVWSTHESLEEEVIALRAENERLRHEAKTWKGQWRSERDHRLRIGKYAPVKFRSPPAPRLFTVTNADGGTERQEWLYTSDVITSGIGICDYTLRMWIDKGRVPESPFRGLDNKRLWTKQQVELLLEVVDKYRQNGRLMWSEQAIKEEIHARWEHVGGSADGLASRKRHVGALTLLHGSPRHIKKKGEHHVRRT
jgi:hypothetical protein